MAYLPKVAVIGHSFIRRLDKDMRDPRNTNIRHNFNLAQCKTHFRWSGGWEVQDKERFNTVIAPFLRQVLPRIVILQLGGNDIDKDEALQTISVASEIEALVMRLLNEFGVSRVIICEIFTRKSPTNVSPQVYEERRTDTMKYLGTMVEHEPRIRVWKHRRIFYSQQEMFDSGGIHLSSLGQERFYRSLRLAIKTAVDQL